MFIKIYLKQLKKMQNKTNRHVLIERCCEKACGIVKKRNGNTDSNHRYFVRMPQSAFTIKLYNCDYA